MTPATVVAEQREWISQSPRHRRSKTPKSRPRASQYPLPPPLYRASYFSIPRYATYLRSSDLALLLFVLHDYLSRLLYRLRRWRVKRAARCRASRLRRRNDDFARELPSPCPPSRKNGPSHTVPLRMWLRE